MEVLKVFPYSVTVTTVQFAVGTVLVILMWTSNLYKRPKISGAQLAAILPLAVVHTLGSHGDGHRSNIDTPLVAWGAGVRHPKPMSRDSHIDYDIFVDDRVHDIPTLTEWGLGTIKRVDVNQADIAPLMLTLLGLPCPANSVGNLPLGYINLNEIEEVEAVLANEKQILNQFLRKSQIKQSSSLRFKPFKPLARYSSVLDQIQLRMSVGDYEAAIELSVNLKRLALEGLDYFQTYDWLMLMTVITLGYIGWIFYLILHVLQSYTM